MTIREEDQGDAVPVPEDDAEQRPITSVRSVYPLLACLACAIALFGALAALDDNAQRAWWAEAMGRTRGAIVDRLGRPLAATIPTRGGAARTYSLTGLAPVTGYRDPSGHWHGLEGKYEAQLAAVRARADWHSYFLRLRGVPVRGSTVRLTLDRSVQSVADAALGKASGAVVALDPRTGGVLALVSKPDCPPATLSRAAGFTRCAGEAAAPLVDRATSKRFAPGSSFKIVTLSAALDTGRFHLSDIFRGADAWGPSPYFDNELYPSNVTRSDLTELTLSQALAFSDNFTFAHIGLTLGAPTLLRYAHRFHIGRSIPFDYPVAVSSIASGFAHPDKATLAQSAFGAPVDQVTPLQMALIAAGVANGGVLMAPYLVESVQSATGKTEFQYREHALGRVMSARGAAEVTAGMEFVVNHGSGFKAQIGGMRVAGKTGTAESGSKRPNAWFICFAPATHPVVAVAVLHQFSGEGFEYAAPIARKVMIAALRERGFHVR